MALDMATQNMDGAQEHTPHLSETASDRAPNGRGIMSGRVHDDLEGFGCGNGDASLGEGTGYGCGWGDGFGDDDGYGRGSSLNGGYIDGDGWGTGDFDLTGKDSEEGLYGTG